MFIDFERLYWIKMSKQQNIFVNSVGGLTRVISKSLLAFESFLIYTHHTNSIDVPVIIIVYTESPQTSESILV